MTENTPDPVARYLAAGTDAHALADIFTPGAVVLDDGHVHIGREGVAAWWAEAAAPFEITTTIVTSESFGPDAYLVVQHITGDFPGGVADLEMRFALSGDHIAALMVYPVRA